MLHVNTIIGATRESVSKTFKDLQDEKIIALESKKSAYSIFPSWKPTQTAESPALSPYDNKNKARD
ncbi:hypothetical protein [Trichococcus patagoniensis]